jgi:outer membrane receptor protein involved in Fe transport
MQPAMLANFSIGYDYKGFSGRLSYSYQDDILTTAQRRPDGADKEATIIFARWDLQLKQKITKNLSIYGSMSNIFNQPDKSSRLVTGYVSSIEYYGFTAYLGIKYDFF